MAEDSGLIGNPWRALAETLAEYRFHAILVVVLGVSLAFVATLTEFLRPYAPLAYVLVGLFGALLVALTLALYGLYKRHTAAAQFAEQRADTGTVNPMDMQFSKLRIKLAEFQNPLFEPRPGMRFEHCELFGPAVLRIANGTFDRVTFAECDFVIVGDATRSTAAVTFPEAVFSQCTFYRVLFQMTRSQYDRLRPSLPKSPNLLTG
jgi:hypothetical protein